MNKSTKPGRLFLISGPSGAGKDETLNYLKELGCKEIKAATTRKKRANKSCDGSLIFLDSEISKEEIIKKGFDTSFIYYGNDYYISTKRVLQRIENGENCVLITSKPNALDSLKKIDSIRENLTHIFIYRNSLTLNFFKNLGIARKAARLNRQEEKEIKHRHEKSRYLFTRLSEDMKFRYVIMNVKNLDFLKKQISNIFERPSNINKEQSSVFFIIGSEQSGKNDLFDIVENKSLNHNIKILKQYTNDISANEDIYKYDLAELAKCDFIYKKRGWKYGIKKKDISEILKNNRVIIDINDLNQIEKIKDHFKKYRSKVGFIFSEKDNKSKRGENILNLYADNIDKVDFTMLNVAPFQNELDTLENLFYYNIIKD